MPDIIKQARELSERLDTLQDEASELLLMLADELEQADRRYHADLAPKMDVLTLEERGVLTGLRDYSTTSIRSAASCCDQCPKTWANRVNVLDALLQRSGS